MSLINVRKIRLALGTSVGSKKVKNKTATWSDFVSLLSEPVRTKERYKEYMSAPKDRQDRIKDVGYYVPTQFENGVRKKSNMDFRDIITLDIDFAAENYLDAIHKAYKGWSYVLHSTHKHGPKNPRLRLLFPLSRAVDKDEYEAVARKVADLLDMDWFDDTTFQFSRVMHFPSVSRDADYVFKANGGDWADPDDILELYSNWRNIEAWPVSSRIEGKLRYTSEKAEDPRDKKGLVGSFCRVYDIPGAIDEFLSAEYQETEVPGRYSYAKGSTANGAVVYDDGLFLYSHHGTDPCSMRLVNAFDLIRIHKFGNLDKGKEEDDEGEVVRATRLPSFIAMREFIQQNCPDVRADMAQNLIEDRVDDGEFDDYGDEAEDDGGITAAAKSSKKEKAVDKSVADDGLGIDVLDEFDDEGPSDKGEKKDGKEKKPDRAWLRELILDKNDQIKVNLRNLTLILKNDPRIRERIGLNEFSRDFVQTKSLLGAKIDDKVNGDLWVDHCDILVKFHLERVYNMQAGLTMIREALDLIAHLHKFHPVKNYLEPLVWDGKQRVETMLVDHLGVKDSPYSRAVARKVMAAAIARIYKPGCKFDYVMVIEGGQGKRKSSFISVLAKGWFTDDLKDFSDARKTVEQLKGKWVIELPELQAFSYSEVETIKAFISRQQDRTREAFARRPDDYPRQCIFIGTTNDEHYLKDETGNRRIWPVRVGKDSIDLDALKKDVDQLWAEAYQIYLEGEPLYLEPEIEALAENEQSARLLDDPLVGQIESWMSKTTTTSALLYGDNDNEFHDEDAPEVYRTVTCAMQIHREALGRQIERYTRADARMIHNALRKIPYITEGERQRFPSPYGRQRTYHINVKQMLRSLDDDLGL